MTCVSAIDYAALPWFSEGYVKARFAGLDDRLNHRAVFALPGLRAGGTYRLAPSFHGRGHGGAVTLRSVEPHALDLEFDAEQRQRRWTYRLRLVARDDGSVAIAALRPCAEDPARPPHETDWGRFRVFLLEEHRTVLEGPLGIRLVLRVSPSEGWVRLRYGLMDMLMRPEPGAAAADPFVKTLLKAR